MNKQQQTSTENPSSLFSHLPDELIHQILLRLPVRSLLRFKSVCKSWRSLISNPQFAKSHFHLDASPTHRIFLNHTNGFRIQSFDTDSSLHDDSSLVHLNFPLAPPHPDNCRFGSSVTGLKVLGSCRGFVLLANHQGNVVVWNPSTGVRRRVPEWCSYLASQCEFLYGIGYDELTDDCLVVFIESNDHVVAHFKPKIKVFSLKTNLPLLLSMNVEYVDLGFEFRPGLFLNEAIHWLVMSRVKNVRVVLAFDLVERSLLEIPLSQDLAMELTGDRKKYHLRVLKGCLGLCYSSFGGMTEMWIMKEYKVESSWTRIVLSACDISHNSFFPICFTKSGDVFGSNEFGRLLRLNDKGTLLEHRSLWRGESRYRVLHSRVYTESLLAFPEETSECYPPL